MKPAPLHQLATAAGVIRRWTDAQGQQRCLDDDTVRRLLEALQWPAASDAQCHESLARLRQEQRELPPLVTADAGAPLPFELPRDAVLRDENGAVQALPPKAGRVRAPPQYGYYTLEYGSHRLTLAVAPARCFGLADACQVIEPRCWGLAAQVYALRRAGDGGVGDSHAVAELATAIGQAGGDALGLSPLHALSAGSHSPYSPSDRCFLNTVHADPGQVLGDATMRAAIQQTGLEEPWQQAESMALIDWPGVTAMRRTVWLALHRMAPQMPAALQRDLADFRRDGGAALATYAALAAAQAAQPDQPQPSSWRQWNDDWEAQIDNAAIDLEIFKQWLARRCWETTGRQARAAGLQVGLIGDLAVGFEPGGGEAWRHRPWLLENLSVGAPPDAFNTRGQGWGITGYSPCGLRRSGFAPFIEVLRANMRLGGIRIDHALGLARLWVIPARTPADAGGYIAYPLHDLLRLIALESWRHRCVVIGEDLGTVPARLHDALAARGVLGTDVLLFNRDAHGRFLPPCAWRRHAVATTTTHDLPPLAGWRQGHDIDWRERVEKAPPGTRSEDRQARRSDVQQLDQALAAVDGPVPAAAGPDWAALRFVARSQSALMLLPLEDALGLREQPNLPGTVDEHPNWRRRLPPADAAPPLAPVLHWIDRNRREACADG